MKNYTNLIILILFIGMLLSTAFSTYKNFEFKDEISRLKNNETALNQDLKHWKSKDSSNVATIAAIAYTKSEIKEFNPDLVQKVKDLGLQLKNVQSILETKLTSQTKIKTVVRDSVVYKDSVKCFKFEDQFTKLNGCFTGDSVDIELKNFEKLTTIIDKVPKHKFLWWSWGVKGINVNIVSVNPNTTFEYLKYIELKK